MAVADPSGSSQVNLLQINPADNVAVAVMPLAAGHEEMVAGKKLTLRQDVTLGGKVALANIAAAEKIVKFGEPIGSASAAILAGEYVHTHNLQSDYIPTANAMAATPELQSS